jgi:hypothetical protein
MEYPFQISRTGHGDTVMSGLRQSRRLGFTGNAEPDDRLTNKIGP